MFRVQYKSNKIQRTAVECLQRTADENIIVRQLCRSGGMKYPGSGVLISRPRALNGFSVGPLQTKEMYLHSQPQ